MLNQSMYFTTSNKGPLSAERHGTVLLIVLVILTMFAGIGIAFMFYAESEANSAAAFRDQFEFRGPDMDPDMAFALFLQQLIFDCRDDTSGITSALRGHSLYRNMYGLKYISSGGSVVLANPLNAFSGTGRLHYTYGVTPGITGPAIFNNIDDYMLINYAYCPSDGFVRYPEFLGTTAQPKGKGGLTFTELPYLGGANPPYSAADMNFMALAAVQADGTVLLPSFHRDWTGFGHLDPSNPNWTANDPKLKYMVLRPRPGDHLPKNGKKGFPLPMDRFGDVRNRPAAWANAKDPSGNDIFNDSFWMYTGAPVLTLPDGRRYTALFAPLVIDLDGKLNVNVAGNIRGSLATHASNQGWGPWEINPTKVLSEPNEFRNMMQGLYATSQGSVPGRYGNSGAANPGNGPTPSPYGIGNILPHYYALGDYDGVIGANPTILSPITGQWTLPGPYQSWPTYPIGYAKSAAELNPGELVWHPALYDPTKSIPGISRVFLPGELNKIYRYGDTNTDSMFGDLWRILSSNFKDVRKRNMITTLSFDRRGFGLMPWQFNASTAQAKPYELKGYTPNVAGPAVRPSGLPFGSPAVGPPTNLGKDFDPLWANKIAISPPNVLKSGWRLDLNKPLIDPNTGATRAVQDYPPLVGTTIDVTGFKNAQKDRQDFASILFQILVKTTGAYDLTNHSNASTPTPGEIDALRYLAQLAVNMVDFIDKDDYITPFNWVAVGNPAFQTAFNGLAGKVVYGTEMPRVVINEAYCHFINGNTTQFSPENDPALTAPGGPYASFYKVEVWAELYNPFKTATTLTENGDARLYVPAGPSVPTAFSSYRLLLTDPNKDMNRPDNTDGTPDGAIKGIVKDKDFQNFQVIKPLPTQTPPPFSSPINKNSNIGFYMVGPGFSDGSPSPFPTIFGAASNTQRPEPTVNAPGMTYRYMIPNAGLPTGTATPPAPTLVLQRLCCPYLPEDTTAGSPTYNPYVTVDYFPNVKINDFSTQGALGNPPNPQTITRLESLQSVGRLQPFVASAPLPQVNPQIGEPHHTFFIHNYRPGQGITSSPPNQWPAPIPPTYPSFDWLYHLDRNLINPMELLHISGGRPFELTQQFTGKMFGHQAPWFDNATRLYRFFEFVETAPRMAGTDGPRVPGKININTVWDLEIFQALADPQPNSFFNDTDIGQIWDGLVRLRNPGGPAAYPGGAPYIQKKHLSPYDQPFLPLSAGVFPVNDPQFPNAMYPFGVGIGNTILRPASAGDAPNSPRLLEPPSLVATGHPAQRLQLLTKIYNNITTRSNCFAVWVTVGFFEVNDVDASGRIYLGQEIGRSEGRNIRHKMFAIIDRSVLDPSMNYTVPAGGAPKTLDKFVGGILDQTIPFNPHATGYRELVPYYCVVE